MTESTSPVKINPIKIKGRWRDGFVLDCHTLSSTWIGDDAYGHPMFDTKRTEVGELLYRLKYRSDNSALEPLVSTITTFLQTWNPAASVIVSVPPSRSSRPRQPVHVIAEALGKRVGISFAPNGVKRTKQLPELKNVYGHVERVCLLEGAHSVESAVVSGQSVLLFDDLYRSGATMNAVTAALYDQGRAADVCALAITKTGSKT